MHASATASSRPIVISRSNCQVFPSSGPLRTSSRYMACQPFERPVRRLLAGLYRTLTNRPGRTITHRVTMNDRIDELLHLIEVEPDALREAEFMQAQAILETLVGKQISGASIEDTRIVISTSDGNRYFFYGFLGGAGD